MNSRPTASEIERLAPPLQRWLWEQGWTGLREAQAEALPLILDGWRDVVIAASTASGKTEAAFLPLLTRLWRGGGKGTVLYVAPMKALINDQHERLGLLCERLEIPVYPWHGDIGQTSRKRFFADPRGAVLITPESLESLLFRRGLDLGGLFAGLEAVVVDELHAFIGSERGRQLQSLLSRLEEALGRKLPRIGLSATLGDMSLAAEFLRPGKGSEVALVVARAERKSLQLAMKTFLCPPGCGDTDGHGAVAEELFAKMRDGNYLIFPNTTGMVEFYADTLRCRCESAGVPVSFFPHHGRLGKSERESVEGTLKRGQLHVSAICTTTLEMGIDIGTIRGIAQIGAPDTVASLCQRIGRAGRREGEAAILRQYCVVEEPAANAEPWEILQPEFLQALAIIRLFLDRWYEPPASGALHLSTLVQQLLALIGERHGVTAAQAFGTLCQRGPFSEVSEADFIELLRGLAAHGLIMQDATRLLLHGPEGEKRVNHYTFFAAFPDTFEYRLLHAGKELGTLPLDMAMRPGSMLIFAGRRWRIVEIDHGRRRVDLLPAPKGQLPRTGGVGLPVHDRVRGEMRALLMDDEVPPWLDGVSVQVLQAARRHFQERELEGQRWLVEGNTVYLFLWRGDRFMNGLAALLRAQGLTVENQGVCLKISRTTPGLLADSLARLASRPCPEPGALFDRKSTGNPEKWDWVLPDRLFFSSLASQQLDLEGAHAACAKLLPDAPSGGRGSQL